MAWQLPGLRYLGIALVAVAAVLLPLLFLAAGLRSSSERPEPLSVPAGAPESPVQTPPVDLADSDEVLRFANEVRVTSLEPLRDRLALELPRLLGVEHIWIVMRFGDRQQVILPRAAPGREAPAERGLAEWATFPLRADTEQVGMLGVDITRRRLSPRALRLVPMISPVIAHALLASHTMDTLRETSTLDPLTGCSTRHDGIQRLRAELRRAERSRKPVGLLMVDLDHFKSINDRFGHNAGDAVLRSVGRTMMQTLRASDIRCRWGGEEFLIVLPDAAVGQARQVAESLVRRIAEMPLDFGTGPQRVTASIGVTEARPGEHDIESLISRSDRALYRAKADGRGCVRIVMGDLNGQPIGVDRGPSSPLPFPDRRDPGRPDRRRVPGPGRRKTDVPFVTMQ